MKFVTYTSEGLIAPGVISEDKRSIVDLSHAYPDVLSLVRDGERGILLAKNALASAAQLLPLQETKLLAPITNPPRLRDCSVFEEHIKGGAEFARKMGWDLLAKVPDVWYEAPIFYKGNHLSIAGPDVTVEVPSYSRRLDYELEISAVIGKGGKNISREEAHNHIFGLMIFNDLTARDAGGKELLGLLGPAKGKDFDDGNVFGPWLVTVDEIPDLYNMGMRAFLNGQKMGEGNTAAMYHKWDRIVEFCSAGETLHSGEIIGSGTVGGGTLIEFGKGLAPGDVVEMEVDYLGTLRCSIAPEK